MIMAVLSPLRDDNNNGPISKGGPHAFAALIQFAPRNSLADVNHHPPHLHHPPPAGIEDQHDNDDHMTTAPLPPTTWLRSPCRWSASHHEHRYSLQSWSRSRSQSPLWSRSCDCKASDPFAQSNEFPPQRGCQI